MVGGSLKSGMSTMKEVKGGIKGLQEKAEKMVKGSLGSILLPGVGGGGGDQGGIKRREGLTVNEKPQQ